MRKSLFYTAIAVAMITSILPSAIADDHYAAKNGQTEAGSYTSWDTAASNIQDAVNAANTNDTVWVGAGRYTGPTNTVDRYGTNVVCIEKPLTLRSSNGVPATTIIDGAGAYRGINCWYTNQNTTNRFVVDGFTISNCYATNMGGGLLLFAYSANWTGEVRNCIISDNTVAWGTNAGVTTPFWNQGSRGGGILCFGYPGAAGFVISNCTIRNNRALHRGTAEFAQGGGIWSLTFGMRQIFGCRIESNSASVGGGCYFNYSYANTKAMIENCTFAGNRTVDSGVGAKLNNIIGGAITFVNQGYLFCRNVLFYDNYSVGRGGAIYSDVTQEFYNCTIVNNQLDGTVGQQGSAIFTTRDLVACNTIIYSNAYDTWEIWSPGINAFFTNCCLTSTNIPYTGVTNGAQGSGNFAANPGFRNWSGRNFRLIQNSPCVNAGFNQAWMTNAVDLDGRTRVRYGAVDLGAYEVIYRGTIYGMR